MVYRHISKDIKERTLWLLEHDFIPSEVAHLLGVSQRSMQRWQNNIALHGSVIALSIQIRGRPHLLSSEINEDLVSLCSESPELFLSEIQEWIAVAHDHAISKSQLHQILKDCGVTYKLMRRAASEQDEERRMAWKEAYMLQYVASQCLWIDESSKDDRTIYRHYGRAIAGA
ncbi:hypothetical protein EDD85DRAFT_989481 [Armillaria nabsnona]|nr:hypothetical protein EDD85DRAFT_989481 [Armillaria nabsnona]